MLGRLVRWTTDQTARTVRRRWPEPFRRSRRRPRWPGGSNRTVPLAIISVTVRRSSSVTPGSTTGGARRMDVSGWPGAPTLIQRILPSPTSLRTSKPRASRQKAREATGSSCGRVLVWIVMSIGPPGRSAGHRRYCAASPHPPGCVSRARRHGPFCTAALNAPPSALTGIIADEAKSRRCADPKAAFVSIGATMRDR